MTSPIILPAEHPLPHAHRVEKGAWFADKLLEAHMLNPNARPGIAADEWPWPFSLIELKARLRP